MYILVKIENFIPEMTYILSQLDGDTRTLRQTLLKQQIKMNPSLAMNPPGWYRSYYQQLSKQQLMGLRRMYRDDFDIFGYNTDIELNLMTERLYV